MNELWRIPWVAFATYSAIASLGTALSDTIVTAAFDNELAGSARFFVFAAVQFAMTFGLIVVMAAAFGFGGGSLASPDASIEGATWMQRLRFVATGARMRNTPDRTQLLVS